MTIDPDKSYTATLELEKGGEIVIELFAKEAPVTVNNFIFLAREGYYNGVTFHRVIPGFMAQGGDPTGHRQWRPGIHDTGRVQPPETTRRARRAVDGKRRPSRHRERPVVHHLCSHSTPGRCAYGVRPGGRGDGRGVRHIATRPWAATSPGDAISSITIQEGA